MKKLFYTLFAAVSLAFSTYAFSADFGYTAIDDFASYGHVLYDRVDASDGARLDIVSASDSWTFCDYVTTLTCLASVDDIGVVAGTGLPEPARHVWEVGWRSFV